MSRTHIKSGTEIIGLGHYAPAHIVTNHEIEANLGLDDGWIKRRTGIEERRFAATDEALSDMAIEAGQMALANAGLDPSDIALTILATSTPDHLLPPSAPLVAYRLGLTRSGAIDMAGACAGFLYALAFADSFARVQQKCVLVIAANILSRRINPAERASAVLFADAAGAVVIKPTQRTGAGLIGCELAADGGGYDLIKIPAGGSRNPFHRELSETDTLMQISDGKAVFVKAVDMMATTARSALAAAGHDTNGITHWLPHQANTRIIEATRNKLEIAAERTLVSVEKYGNSSAATIPFTMSLLAAQRTYRPGDIILFSAAGAGLTGGSIVWRW
ncbi:MAG: beta-ketoacyl-ACP synthase III [Hyphomicrobiaceae bacterium]|nr:beta-ketoacyl-ACP synthase III [Hyphomicrobiaceae bacterium]MCC0009576.1 beta-ketoacyl-ACP synthase III [Hyphomicrobiaceae bacterium]